MHFIIAQLHPDPLLIILTVITLIACWRSQEMDVSAKIIWTIFIILTYPLFAFGALVFWFFTILKTGKIIPIILSIILFILLAFLFGGEFLVATGMKQAEQVTSEMESSHLKTLVITSPVDGATFVSQSAIDVMGHTSPGVRIFIVDSTGKRDETAGKECTADQNGDFKTQITLNPGEHHLLAMQEVNGKVMHSDMVSVIVQDK